MRARAKQRKSVLGLSLILLMLVEACKTTQTSKPNASADTLKQVFPKNRIVEIKLQIDPLKWDALRKQGNDLRSLSCENTARVEYENQDAQLWLDGEDYGKVKVKKKGFLGSQQQTKPSLKIKLGSRKVFELNRLVLNNNHQDPAQMRQCLAYEAFAQAGLPAAACGFVRLNVNGVDLGIYTHVEEYSQAFLETVYGTKTDVLLEGTISDFTPAYLKTFEVKEGDSTLALTKLAAITEILARDEGDLVEKLSEHIDMDEFFRFWALEVILGHWDGYANNRNNFFMRLDASRNKLQFIPWGVDNVFSNADSFYKGPQPRPNAISATSKLTHRLFADPKGKKLYLEALDKLNRELSTKALLDRAQAYKEMLGSQVAEKSYQSLVSFLNNRSSVIQTDLDKAAVSWPLPYKDGEPCLASLGNFSAKFESSWLGDINPRTPGGGGGSMQFTLNGETMQFSTVYSVSGIADSTIRPQPTIILVGKNQSDTYIAQIHIEGGLYSEGGLMKFQGFSTYGVLLKVSKEGAIERKALISAGELKFDKNGRASGETVSGEITGGMFSFP